MNRKLEKLSLFWKRWKMYQVHTFTIRPTTSEFKTDLSKATDPTRLRQSQQITSIISKDPEQSNTVFYKLSRIHDFLMPTAKRLWSDSFHTMTWTLSSYRFYLVLANLSFKYLYACQKVRSTKLLQETITLKILFCSLLQLIFFRAYWQTFTASGWWIFSLMDLSICFWYRCFWKCFQASKLWSDFSFIYTLCTINANVSWFSMIKVKCSLNVCLHFSWRHHHCKKLFSLLPQWGHHRHYIPSVETAPIAFPPQLYSL